jgi:hypothetical protein
MEALTRITEGHAPDEVYEEVRCECSDGALIALSMAFGGIERWSRMAISFRRASQGLRRLAWPLAAQFLRRTSHWQFGAELSGVDLEIYILFY